MRDQTIALAGMFQSLALVQDAARTGGGSEADAFDACIQSVLRIDAADAVAVYGGLSDLRLGLTTLLTHLERRMTPQHVEQAHYAANLMFLERRLRTEAAVTAKLRHALGELQREFDGRAADDGELIAALARVYVDCISPLGPRVLINGEPGHLKRESTAARIRALLLAGLRACVLWRQSGGGRFRLMLLRRRYAGTANDLLSEAAA